MVQSDSSKAPKSSVRDDAESRDRLWGMIKRHRFAMMATLHPGKTLRSRPMTTIQKEFDGSLWFFAKSDSAVAEAIVLNQQVCLSYGDAEAMDFVCVAGPAQLVVDAEMKKRLWSPPVQAWFPEGAESPGVVLIRVKPDHAEYWDSNSNQLVVLFSLARAIVTGTTPQDIGEHRHVAI